MADNISVTSYDGEDHASSAEVLAFERASPARPTVKPVQNSPAEQVSTKRDKAWLLLEWSGTVLFGLVPDTRLANRVLARIFYLFCNRWTLPNLSKPARFNEKLMNLKTSDDGRSALRAQVTDKEFVKDFVNDNCGPGHVPPTLDVIRDKSQIDDFEFPIPCVVKPTHSSQEVLHLANRQPNDEERGRMKYWMWKNYFSASREPNYKNLDHKLIIEPVIGGVFGAIDDVKIMCFQGEPKLIQIDGDRYGEHRRDFYDLAGNHLPLWLKYSSSGRAFPHHEKLPELLHMARKLCKNFSFMRADFYISDGKILVGELTSYPSNCVHNFNPRAADLTMARLFDEPDLVLSPELFEEAAQADHAGGVIPKVAA